MTAVTSHVIDQAERRHTRGIGRQSLAVYKFGGAALADGRAVERAAGLVAERGTAPTVVVASALAGVTDMLLAIARSAASGETVGDDIARLRARHLHIVDDVAHGPAGRCARAFIVETFDEIETLARAVRDAGHLSRATLDGILAFGEQVSAEILVAALDIAGLNAGVVDATAVIYTTGRNGDAAPDVGRVRRAATALLKPLLGEGIVPVVPGFIGRGIDGNVVTLGRGGSDLTATLLARALGARQTVLWKDVPGILTADPRAVPGARLVSQITTREAAALASHGAKLLHPRALVPLTTRTRLWIRPFAQHGGIGTGISARRSTQTPIKAIAASSEQALLTITATGFLPLAGVAARAYAAIDTAGLAGSLTNQVSSSHAISFTLRNDDAPAAADALHQTFTVELANGEIDTIEVRRPVVTIGIIGQELAKNTELVTRTFDSLADAGIEAIASTQRTADIALSVIVDAARATDAQRALHDAFQLDKAGGGRLAGARRVDVVLLGVGAIGRELLSQVGAARSPVRVCGVIDRSGYLFDPRGFSRARIAEVVATKSARQPLASLTNAQRAAAVDAFAAICDNALTRPVLVDATAAETAELLEQALERGWDLVLANKLPLASDQTVFDRLRRTADNRGRFVLHEATVGAGLPVIDTLRKLQEAGDRVLRIEGCPSGTLGFLFGELGRGRIFSDALRSAVQAGYTEPDPRVDLSGADVARKALILARLIGFRGGLADVSVESLIPEQLRDVPLADFLARLEELDQAWQERVGAARARGRVLRYRARVTKRSIEVGLVAVDSTGTLGALDGTDNQFAFTTTRYRTQPLVITGPGAGPAVTAAGVYNDLLRLAERGRR